jgi:phosphoribosylaminoimidazole-succinocarboxamide synthase
VLAGRLRDASFAIYRAGRDHAAARGIIIADTKFEFGTDAAGTLRLIDEVMTPDSSRFWPADRYQPGRPQPSFDKQPLRDYLAGLRSEGRWNGEAPPPPLPAEVVEATSARYLEAYRRPDRRRACRVVFISSLVREGEVARRAGERSSEGDDAP